MRNWHRFAKLCWIQHLVLKRATELDHALASFGWKHFLQEVLVALLCAIPFIGRFGGLLARVNKRSIAIWFPKGRLSDQEIDTR